MFSFGIEHEVAFFNDQGQFADFSCTSFAALNQIIEQLPFYPDDYAQLRIGDAGIKKKRWYIEGFERFNDSEKVVDCAPKGIEIRTTIHPTIQGAIVELSESFVLLRQVAAQYGFVPVLTSFNPYHTAYEPTPPLNPYEVQRRQASPEKQTANIPMLTYGPDLNISMVGLSPEQVIDRGRKLTFYSPYLVPFSFSSPFYQGKLWQGLSVRTHMRTGVRPAAMVFLKKTADLIDSNPSLTKIARLPAEVGRIEFKAFDSCDDFGIYEALLALLKGLVLDRSLPGRATVPDMNLHQLSAHQGFENETIWLNASQILQAAEVALANDPDIHLLQRLHMILERRETLANRLIRAFQQLGTIEQALQQTY
ncbi:MAG: glutamate--cysteine ligase [Timaviella obliquedivisa GSE-PSE-MK23-08B]|jgi:gamma-glutamyl:cysteine ligase YbdK (ATP-grasp superfamily)|nr:glutamate--cysteine ligase [Timaviella obliquedivisa GSE-PSE-MK23-08B]